MTDFSEPIATIDDPDGLISGPVYVIYWFSEDHDGERIEGYMGYVLDCPGLRTHGETPEEVVRGLTEILRDLTPY